jgi:hypothetical protein
VSGIFAGLAADSGSVALNITAIGDSKPSGTATGSLTLSTDGSQSTAGTDSVAGSSWWSAAPLAGVGNSYWAKMTVNSGSALSGAATGSVLALSSSRTWSLSRTGIGSNTSNVTLEIFSDAGGTQLVASKSFAFTATIA